MTALCARCGRLMEFPWDYGNVSCPPCRVEAALLAAIEPGWSVLDVGAGLAQYHRALHAHTEGNLVLLEAHLPTIVAHVPPKDATMFIGDLRYILPALRDHIFDAVIAIDVIEHLDKPDGFVALREMRRIAERRVCVFTPDGFMPQDKDRQGLGNDYWQTHRSGWTVADLTTFGFQRVETWPAFHEATVGALWAEATIPHGIAL